jgi:hypothetical protein
MDILDKYVAFVKDHGAFHEKRAQEFQTSSPSRAKRHRQTAETLNNMLADFATVGAEFALLKLGIEKTPNSDAAPQQAKSPRLSLTEEDIQGLPGELLNELSLSAGDRTEFAILSIMEESNGISTLDRLLIGLYRKTGEILKRDKLISRLYRMAQKNLVYSVSGKKGVYTLEPPAGTQESVTINGDD